MKGSRFLSISLIQTQTSRNYNCDNVTWSLSFVKRLAEWLGDKLETILTNGTLYNPSLSIEKLLATGRNVRTGGGLCPECNLLRHLEGRRYKWSQSGNLSERLILKYVYCSHKWLLARDKTLLIDCPQQTRHSLALERNIHSLQYLSNCHSYLSRF